MEDSDPRQQNHRPWLLNDPERPDPARFPAEQHAHKYVVRVNAGDVLFLPALWYHQVAQEGDPCIAVNTWYDMAYDVKYCYVKFMERLADTRKMDMN